MLHVCLSAPFGLTANNIVMEDLEKNMKLKSFDFASDIAKQLILLSSSIFTITISFREYIFGKDAEVSSTVHGLLIVVWFFFIISIISGIITLRALAGSLNSFKNKEKGDTVSIYDCNIRTPAILQGVTFIFALFFAVIAVL